MWVGLWVEKPAGKTGIRLLLVGAQDRVAVRVERDAPVGLRNEGGEGVFGDSWAPLPPSCCDLLPNPDDAGSV
jgi:hypothetical protein